jgi:preprotein translocase subunit SecG
MQVLLNVMVVVQMVAALVMIGLVLIQHGKGADMGASFGSGSAGSLFGASGSANFLSRSTAIAATVFLCCTLALSILSGNRTNEGGPSSVLERAAAAASAASAPASAVAQIPNAVPAAAVPAASVAAPASAASAAK